MWVVFIWLWLMVLKLCKWWCLVWCWDMCFELWDRVGVCRFVIWEWLVCLCCDSLGVMLYVDVVLGDSWILVSFLNVLWLFCWFVVLVVYLCNWWCWLWFFVCVGCGLFGKFWWMYRWSYIWLCKLGWCLVYCLWCFCLLCSIDMLCWVVVLLLVYVFCGSMYGWIVCLWCMDIWYWFWLLDWFFCCGMVIEVLLFVRWGWGCWYRYGWFLFWNWCICFCDCKYWWICFVSLVVMGVLWCCSGLVLLDVL